MSATTLATVRPADRDDVPAAAGILARAFHTDPLMLYAFPDPARRARALAAIFRTIARFTHTRGLVLAHGDDAASLWVAPGAFPTSDAQLARHGMLAWPLHLGVRGMTRLMGGMEGMDHAHNEHMPTPHWYLWALGVEPHAQGRGLGSAILRAGLARVDAQRLPCYLETAQPRNVPLYERHGFRIVVEYDVQRGGPRMWGMRREAVGAQSQRP